MNTPSSSRRRGRHAYDHRMRRLRDYGMKPRISEHDGDATEAPPANAVIDCGWGRLLFGQTFESPEDLVQSMRHEGPDRRDIAFYIRDPHIVVAAAPQELFLDPSDTYRLDLSTYRQSRRKMRGFFVRRLNSIDDAEAVNRIYMARDMVPVPPDFFWRKRDSRAITNFVAEDETTGEILGTVTGVDHWRAFNDPEHGSSLWCLAVDPQATRPAVGEALVRRLAEHFSARGARYMDLSVMHNNEQAIRLYEKLGFVRIPVFAIKRKNPINEPLFSGPEPDPDMNPYARIIIDEARRRGIRIEIVDAAGGFFRLSYGGRAIMCRESLSELTTAVAMSICDDKAVTRRLVEKAGILVPEQIQVSDRDGIRPFLEKHGSVVVKPARGEQGRGVSVALTTMDEIEAAVAAAREISSEVLIEQYVEGEDLRIIVIDHRVVAAAIRRPPRVIGDGQSTIRDLIERQSRRRSAATGGESRIPIDDETVRYLARKDYGLDDVLEKDLELEVRKTANLHTGGTIHDVTDHVHPVLIRAAVNASRAIEIPVVGIDLMVSDVKGPDYAFIEANERPGLANHEPQPTAERFIDLLFPTSMPAAARSAMEHGMGAAT